mmetsp:Transcript_24470/g.68604  ORF Transcript_24470/g.68604 Transcript_24470/m.68604 type:complete len:191 (-) Transcript_24470:91-663(-)|eukprot:CAMPEP_0119119906 /NCGR_PEP_ID=MMETSP1310-20130426/1195_1 /TAXON_ID=464262 /ORGANISM="Genus nov. species nov., Strain RCC2339" /LENGTH=190 /DNA_ID=CAMNT_0007109365 /DNA_START=131 /DNA_END=703 /DNA_ORIENTATION=-
MGCCFSEEEGAGEREGLLQSQEGKKARKGKSGGRGPASPGGGGGRGGQAGGYQNAPRYEEPRAVPVQEERRLAEVAAQTQKDFIAIPPSSMQEPSALEPGLMREREELYRQQMAQAPGEAGAAAAPSSARDVVVTESDVRSLLHVDGEATDANVRLITRAGHGVGDALDAIEVRDVGNLTVSFENISAMS